MKKAVLDFFSKIKSKFVRNDDKSNFDKKKDSNIFQVTDHPKNFQGFLSNLQWENIIKEVFSPESRKVAHKIFLVMLIGCSSYSFGKISAVILENQLSAKKKQNKKRRNNYASSRNINNDLNKVFRKNLFNAKVTDKDKGPVQKAVQYEKDSLCKDAKTKSSLRIKLINTVVLQNSKKSIAAIQVQGARPETFREGDKIKLLAEVGRIERQRLIFRNRQTGTCEYIENTDSKFKNILSRSKYKVLSPTKGKQLINKTKNTGIENEGNKFAIKKTYRDEMLKDINTILTQARAIPIKNPDGTYSFKMTEIVPGSIYSKLNIQEGDIISGINGNKIQSINEVMTLFGQITKIDNFQLTVNRDSMEQTLEYNFE